MQLAALLKAKTWDLPALRALAEGGAEATRDVLDGLKRLAALTPPNVPAVQEAVNRLRQSAEQLAALHGTDAARSLARARLLEQALAFHALTHAGTTCPVCGAADGLSATWTARSQQEVDALKAEAVGRAGGGARGRRRPCVPRARWCANPACCPPPPPASCRPSRACARRRRCG